MLPKPLSQAEVDDMVSKRLESYEDKIRSWRARRDYMLAAERTLTPALSRFRNVKVHTENTSINEHPLHREPSLIVTHEKTVTHRGGNAGSSYSRTTATITHQGEGFAIRFMGDPLPAQTFEAAVGRVLDWLISEGAEWVPRPVCTTPDNT